MSRKTAARNQTRFEQYKSKRQDVQVEHAGGMAVTKEIREEIRQDAEMSVGHLQHLLDSHSPNCVQTSMAIVTGTDIATALHMLGHPANYGWKKDVPPLDHDLFAKLEDIAAKENLSAAFKAFAGVAFLLATSLLNELEQPAPIDHRTLENFAAKIGEKVQTSKDGAPLPRPLIGSASSFICTSEDPNRLIFSVRCANPFVADSVEDMVSNALSPVPEARASNEQGHTLLGFTFDPDNAEAVQWVLKLKNQPGNLIQLPLQSTVVN